MRLKIVAFGVHMLVTGAWVGRFQYGCPFSHWVVFSAVCAVWVFVDLWKGANDADSI